MLLISLMLIQLLCCKQSKCAWREPEKVWKMRYMQRIRQDIEVLIKKHFEWLHCHLYVLLLFHILVYIYSHRDSKQLQLPVKRQEKTTEKKINSASGEYAALKILFELLRHITDSKHLHIHDTHWKYFSQTCFFLPFSSSIS